MSEEKLTAAQQAVIDNEGGSLLVSAAAGSGKTMVLVRRLLRKICDENDPKNIDDFLIITYTKAAAAELRGKIARQISKELAANPGNRHLAKQLNRLYLAQISTVHSFCATLLRSYAHALDIPADFRVAEELETAALKQKVLEKTLDEVYSEMAAEPDIKEFIDTLGYGRDDRKAGKIVLSIYDSARCHIDMEAWMNNALSAVETQNDTPLWEKALLHDYREKTLQMSRLMRALAAQCMQIPPFDTQYVPVILEDAQRLEELAQINSWQMLGEKLKLGTLKRVAGDIEPEFKKLIQDQRRGITQKYNTLLETFALTRDEAAEEIHTTGLAIRGAFRIVRRFAESYAQAKRRRHWMDYSDLEHEAVRLLVQKGTTLPTKLAREISQQYVQIMVDEYQDTNELQDTIFTAISRKGENLFMVGDVKQSIYRFRLADPTIFLEKYRTYLDYDKAKAHEPRKILLSANFRSKPEILDAVNCVFGGVMSEDVGDLEYGPREALHDERNQPLSSEPLVELHCISVPDNSGVQEEDEIGKPEIEAEWVAGRIEELISSGEAEPKDITILLRAAKSDARYYTAALERRRISTQSSGGGSILDTVEIESLQNLLQVLDNPHQDIPLIGAMASPIFGWSYDDLARLRAGRRQTDFFDALCDAAKTEKRLQSFVETLTRLQMQQRLCRLSELLQLLEKELSLRRIFAAMENGRARVRNLNAFYQIAAAFEADEPKTLHQFLSYLDELEEQEISPATEGSNAVQITTIHKSKGLEYPIVFFAGLSKQFNLKDSTESVLSHPSIGVACSVVDPQSRIYYPSAAKRAIMLQQKKDTVSEEMRVLYVGMTRPKNRLIMSYCSGTLRSDLRRIALLLSGGTVRQAAQSARGMGDWILMTAMRRMEGSCLAQYAQLAVEKEISKIPWRIELHEDVTIASKKTASVFAPPVLAQLPPQEELKRTLHFQYAHCAATKLPDKLTATQLKGRAIDEETAAEAAQLVGTKHFYFPRPRFAQAARELTAAERGTATHLAMQYIRYENCNSLSGVAQELDRLLCQHYLTQQQYEAVSAQTIWQFFSSPLGQKVQNAGQIVREFKFSVLVDAKVLDPAAAGEQIMLQGVTDCCILEPDGFTVIDFKTDRVTPGKEERLAQYYKGQLEAYGTALSRVFHLPVKKRLLYFFATGSIQEV